MTPCAAPRVSAERPGRRPGRAAATRVAAALASLLAGATPQALAAPPAPHLAPQRANVVETTFESVDAVVAGQWEFPQITPAPLVVLLPASASVDRDGLPSGADNPPSDGIYHQLARALVDAGFAVFRYDSPGTGRSSHGRYATERSTALEGFARAVDHARVDTSQVYLLGHSASTDAIVGIYPRYEAINPVAGVILLSNRVGETDLVRVGAPTLIVVTDKNPDDLYQHGRFPADARARQTEPKLSTELVTVPEADHSLLSAEETSEGKRYSFDPRVTEAVLRWLGQRRGSAPSMTAG
jgi:alpha/beta superfamily hydrolase